MPADFRQSYLITLVNQRKITLNKYNWDLEGESNLKTYVRQSRKVE